MRWLGAHLPTLTWALVCALAAANLWIGPGIVNTRAGGDSPFLLIRTYELAENLRAGVFPARWMANAAFGLGYPFFNFYAALPYYLAAVFNVLGVDLLVAIKLTQTLGMFAAGAAMARLAEDVLPRADAHVRRWAAAIAAAAYTVTPFHLANVYVRGDSLSEFWAFVWYPIILWHIQRLIVAWATPENMGQQWVHMIGLALGLACLVLTHNVSALLFAPFAALYALACHLRWTHATQRGRVLIALGGAAVWALGLSAWFWLPALGEAGQVQLGAQTTGYFYFANHFRSEDLIQHAALFDYSVDQDLRAFAIGGPHALGALIGAVIWLRAARRDNHLLFDWSLIVACCALSIFMITPLSSPVWERAPLLPLAQFPWRFLSIQGCFGALLIGGIGLIGSAIKHITMHRRIVTRLYQYHHGMVAAFTIAILSASGLARLPNARLDVQSSDVSPWTIQLYEWYTGNIGTTIRHEYLPATALPVPRTGPDLLGLRRAAVAEAAPAEAVHSALRTISPAGQSWQVTTQRTATIALPIFYWPAWHVQLDGQPWPSWPHPGSGWMALTVPAGAHQLEVRWVGTPLTRSAETGSALAWLGLLVLAGWRAWRAPAAARRRAVGKGLAALAAIGAIVGLGRLLSPPDTPPPLQTLDFERRPFPHRAPVRFAGASETYTLIGATITPTTLRAGQPFTLTLRWQDDRTPAQITTTQELPMGAEAVRLFRHARLEVAGDPRISRQTVISGALPGPLLLKLSAADTQGQRLTPLDTEGLPLTALIAGGPAAAITLVGPTIVSDEGLAHSPGRLNLHFGNGIILHDLDWLFISAHEACLRPVWRRDGAEGNRADVLQSSLRVFGSDGRLIVQADGQPQAGLAPTWAWPNGALVYDSLCLPVKRMLRDGEPYTMHIIWYRLLDLRPTGELRLRGVNAGQIGHLNLPVAVDDSR